MPAVLVLLKCKPEMVSRFESLAREMIAYTRENEPDCLRYEYWRLTEPNSYCVLETYNEVDDFYAHEAGARHRALAPAFL